MNEGGIMDLETIWQVVNNFVYGHPYVAIAIAAVIVIGACLRPKKMLKFVLVILGVLVAGYRFFPFGQAVLSGMTGKEQMITK